LLDELSLLPEALADIELGSSGAPLSYAQLLRLLLARAMAGRPGLLIVDGILDEMDEATRHRVTAALCARDTPWTLLVMTRSPAVAALCGRIVELPGETRHA
jgi:putative ABC transport system ATP-binding protein